ncbi:MAG TPA: hypothetical protein VIK73_08495 [Limnochordales bacterium]
MTWSPGVWDREAPASAGCVRLRVWVDGSPHLVEVEPVVGPQAASPGASASPWATLAAHLATWQLATHTAWTSPPPGLPDAGATPLSPRRGAIVPRPLSSSDGRPSAGTEGRP